MNITRVSGINRHQLCILGAEEVNATLVMECVLYKEKRTLNYDMHRKHCLVDASSPYESGSAGNTEGI